MNSHLNVTFATGVQRSTQMAMTILYLYSEYICTIQPKKRRIGRKTFAESGLRLCAVGLLSGRRRAPAAPRRVWKAVQRPERSRHVTLRKKDGRLRASESTMFSCPVADFIAVEMNHDSSSSSPHTTRASLASTPTASRDSRPQKNYDSPLRRVQPLHAQLLHRTLVP